MLVVVAIMMLLLAAAATRMKPANESRRIRESARALSIYLSTARNRAMETGRPCGVILHRFAGATSAVMGLDQCEVPPCYCGDTTNAALTFTTVNVARGVATIATKTTPAGSFNQAMVSVGDLIQFNFQGPLFTINGLGQAAVTATLDVSQGQSIPWSTTSPAIPYRIYRLPSSTSATTFKGQAQSLQLPASTVVDLDGSGIDGAATPFNQFSATTNDVGILFSPNGSVYGAYYVNGASTYVTTPIFLLVGKRERVGATPIANDPATWSNWQDLTNLWVVINPQTGLVTSGEMAAVPAWNSTVTYAAGQYVLVTSTNTVWCCTTNNTNQQPQTGSTYWTSSDAFTAARVLARDAQSMGGK
jgi:Tfp pilus assembly protein FimT